MCGSPSAISYTGAMPGAWEFDFSIMPPHASHYNNCDLVPYLKMMDGSAGVYPSRWGPMDHPRSK